MCERVANSTARGYDKQSFNNLKLKQNVFLYAQEYSGLCKLVIIDNEWCHWQSENWTTKSFWRFQFILRCLNIIKLVLSPSSWNYIPSFYLHLLATSSCLMKTIVDTCRQTSRLHERSHLIIKKLLIFAAIEWGLPYWSRSRCANANSLDDIRYSRTRNAHALNVPLHCIAHSIGALVFAWKHTAKRITTTDRTVKS